MLFDQPGLFDQHGCTPFLARLDGSLASTISPPLKTDDGDTASPPLLISMYSDAQCPCSAQFVSDVRHIMRHRAFNGSVDLEQIFVPTCMDVFDHCSDDPEVQAQQFLQCIHGDEECLGHRYFLCAQQQAMMPWPPMPWPPRFLGQPEWLEFQRTVPAKSVTSSRSCCASRRAAPARLSRNQRTTTLCGIALADWAWTGRSSRRAPPQALQLAISCSGRVRPLPRPGTPRMDRKAYL